MSYLMQKIFPTKFRITIIILTSVSMIISQWVCPSCRFRKWNFQIPLLYFKGSIEDFHTCITFNSLSFESFLPTALIYGYYTCNNIPIYIKQDHNTHDIYIYEIWQTLKTLHIMLVYVTWKGNDIIIMKRFLKMSMQNDIYFQYASKKAYLHSSTLLLILTECISNTCKLTKKTPKNNIRKKPPVN